MGKEDLPWAGQVTSARVRVHCNIKARADQRTHNNKHDPPPPLMPSLLLLPFDEHEQHPLTRIRMHTQRFDNHVGAMCLNKDVTGKKVTSNFEQALEPTSEKTPV